MTTVAALKRALEETAKELTAPDGFATPGAHAINYLLTSPTALTMLANRLSDRGKAGNAAARSNLIVIEAIKGSPGLSKIANDALEWAIDQLTPPEPARQPYLLETDAVIRIRNRTGGDPIAFGNVISFRAKNGVALHIRANKVGGYDEAAVEWLIRQYDNPELREGGTFQ